MRYLIALIALAFFSFPVVADITFKKNGKTVMVLKNDIIRSGMLQLRGDRIKAKSTRLFNAWRGKKRTYKGYSLFEVLNAVYGPNWRNSKTISFAALDGYRQTANTKKMIKASEGKKGILSYREHKKKGFTKFKRKNKVVDPGPYYVVWSHFSKKDKARHSDTLKWPYQLKSIEIKN